MNAPRSPESLSLPGLLLVDDNPEIRDQMKWGLKANYAIFEADHRAAALDVLQKEKMTLVTLDLGLPPDASGATEGLATLEQLLAVNPLVKVVVITGNQDRSNALKAVQLGAYDFMEKPVQLDVLKIVLQRANYLVGIEVENQKLLAREEKRGFPEIIGSSPAMAKVFDTIRRVAGSDVSILIVGESGTGKELVARAIHQQSHRSEGPFIAINCGAIPETLLESELFGHEKGAFTGAHQQRKGRIELAQGGTLFLDEIAEISPALQVKLLRVLQEHSVERVGGRVTIPVDTRVLAATNIDIQTAMKEGRFREDLYYRLNTVTIPVPPLRERGADIVVIAKSLLQKFSDEAKKKITGFSKEATLALEQYPWPGNVRELENRVRRAVTLTDNARIIPEDLDLAEPQEINGSPTLKAARDAVEKKVIEQALAKTGGNITKAATLLEISRPTLHDLITRHHIKK